MATRLETRTKNEYRSNGERTIAGLLDKYGIPFRYEPDIFLKGEDKCYIWHPDFYLPDYRAIIEYLGLSGNHDYDQITRRKKRIYHQNDYHFVPVYPETLQKDYQSYIFKSIQTYLSKRLDDLCSRTLHET